MRIFVGCSSKNEINENYKIDCKNYLQELFKQDFDLVFGAYDASLMGIAYHEALNQKHKIIAICPEAYKSDLKTLKCDEEYLTETVNQRTESLLQQSDVLLYLPGGIGTFHEFFAAIESKRCHEFDKPIILYNCCGFYDDLIKFLNKAVSENFIPDYIMDSFHISNSVEDTLEYINSQIKTKKLELNKFKF